MNTITNTMKIRNILWIVGTVAVLVAVMATWWVPQAPSASVASTNGQTPAKWSHGTRLVMFTEDGCPWCELFKKEVMPIYANTEEGKAAPMWEVDIFDPRPAELRHVGRIVYTPTFVLIDEKGRVVGRIEGYPGFDFFWQRLDGLLKEMKMRQGQENNHRKSAAKGGTAWMKKQN